MIKIVLSLEEKVSSLEVVKGLVSKMNDFKFRPDTDNNRLAYQNYRNQLREALLINRLIKENIELNDSISVATFNPIVEHSEIRPR